MVYSAQPAYEVYTRSYLEVVTSQFPPCYNKPDYSPLHTSSLFPFCTQYGKLTRAILLVMNALDTPLAVLRQLLTRGSVLTSLGNDTLAQIRGVSYEQATRTAELQNLGLITNLGYSSFPPPYGQAPQPMPVSDDFDETPTKLADLGLGATPTVPNQPRPPAAQKREAVRLPKVKQKRQVVKPMPQPVSTTVSEPAKYCPVCHWRFPATYTDTEIRRHTAFSATNRCKEDIADYRESQRTARKRRTPQQRNPHLGEQSLAAQYGGVRLCPHCKLSLESGFTPHSKKTHIEACAQPRVRPAARHSDPSDPFALGLSLLKKRRVVVEDSS